MRLYEACGVACEHVVCGSVLPLSNGARRLWSGVAQVRSSELCFLRKRTVSDPKVRSHPHILQRWRPSSLWSRLSNCQSELARTSRTSLCLNVVTRAVLLTFTSSHSRDPKGNLIRTIRGIQWLMVLSGTLLDRSLSFLMYTSYLIWGFSQHNEYIGVGVYGPTVFYFEGGKHKLNNVTNVCVFAQTGLLKNCLCVRASSFTSLRRDCSRVRQGE